MSCYSCAQVLNTTYLWKSESCHVRYCIPTQGSDPQSKILTYGRRACARES